MGLKQIFCVDMEPIAAPQMYLCPKLDENVLMTAAVRYTRAGEEIPQGQIADGAQFTVAPGQCLLLTKGGQITEVCAQPGVYLYNRAEPASFLMGTMTRVAANQPKQPQDGTEQVIYLNGEEYGANAFTCPEKLTFQNDEGEPVSLMCRGRYCYRIANPILFYNYATTGTDRASLGAFLLEQFMTVLQPTYDRLAAMGVTDTTLSQHTPELIATLRAMLYEKWYLTCGVELQRVSITSVCMGSGFNPFGGTTVQADREELSPDDQLEKAAKEFLGSVLSAFGSAIKNANEPQSNASSGEETVSDGQ